jgi:pilus assembly protein CpaE
VAEEQYNAGTPNVALICVGLEPELAEEVAYGAGAMPWNVYRADLETYVSPTKRPPLPQSVKLAHHCIAVIDFDRDIEQALDTIAYIQELFSGKAALIARSTSRDHDVLLRAMRSGCNDFIGGAFDAAAFDETLKRIAQQWTMRATSNAARGSVVTFLGAKGGVGTTTLAVHFAYYLVQCHKKKVLLIDNHPQLGHVCVYLGIDGTSYYFHELVRNLNRLDSELLRGYIASHPSGLDVLSSPDVVGARKIVEPEAMAQTLDFLRGEYDYVLVDCASTLDDTNLAVIDASNHVFLVATPEIGAIRDLSRMVDNLTQNDQNSERIKAVINRFTSQHGVAIEQIEKAIRLPANVRLPNSYAEVVRAGILGQPIDVKQKGEFPAQILKWVTSIAGPAAGMEPAAAKKSGFSLWK